MRRICLVAIVFLFVCQMPVRADWLGFRGPGHQGHAGPGDYPIKWGPDENVAWKVKLPGPGTSSPVIQGDRVFITCFTGKKAKELTRLLICLDRKTGKILWEQKRPAPQPENDYTGHLLQHGFATGTPMIEGDRIYVNFSRGGGFCFDLDGKEIWHRELGKFLNSFSSGSNPSIFGVMLLVNRTTEAGALFAFNKKNGETIWRAKIPGDCWATPLVVEVGDGKKEIVLNGQDGLYGFDPDSGKQLWNCDTVGGYVSSTPVVYKDTLYLIGSNFGRKKAAAIRAGGRGDVSKSHVLWSNDKVGASYCSPLLIGDRLYFFSGQATCLNRDGRSHCAKSPRRVVQLYSSPIEAGGKIYLFTRKRYVLAADEKMAVVSHNDLGDTSAINASPAASGGDVLIRTQEYLYCLRKK